MTSSATDVEGYEGDGEAPEDKGAEGQAGTAAEGRATEKDPAAGADYLLAALVRLTHLFSRPVAEADVRGAAPVPRRGMSISSFVRVAQRLGYKAAREPVSAGAVASMPVPFVLIPKKGRLVRLAVSREGDDIVVVDPVSGDRGAVSPAQIEDACNEAILVKPDTGVGDKAGRATRTSGWRGMIARRVRGVMGELLLASLVINIFALIAPLFMMTVYNKVIGQRALDTLTVLAIGMVAVYGFEFVLRVARGYISSHTGARIDALIGGEVVHRLLHQPFRYFESAPSGQISERLRQLDTIRAFFTGQMPMTIVDLAFVALFIAALMFISPLFGFIAMAAIPLFVLVSLIFHRRQKRLISESFTALSAKTSALNETINNAVTIKSLGLESEVERRWESRLATAAWHGFKSHNVSNWLTGLTTSLQQLFGLLVIVLGATLVIDGELTIGALIAASILTTRALAPLRQVVSAWYQVQEVRAAFERLSEVMDSPMEESPGDVAPQPPLRGDIAVEEVHFSFEQDQPPILKDASINFDSGKVTAIIGPSGSGKSTLVKLLQGLYQPSQGRVLVDGTDIAHVSRAALRSQLGVVPQESQLFSGSVRENIMMGQPLDVPERAVAAAKFVGAHDFIQRLPKGYDSQIGERGVGLSAGQRQLICIARALIRNPRILILDEATSALDPASEELLLRSLRRHAQNRTIIMITHRMAPLYIADTAVLLINGQVEKIGTPRDVTAYARERMAPQQQVGGPQPASTDGSTADSAGGKAAPPPGGKTETSPGREAEASKQTGATEEPGPPKENGEQDT